jgi:hypothetical protein
MKVEIINKNFTLDIYGFSGVAINKDYTRTAIQLMDKMWQTVKAKELKHKGINIWVWKLFVNIFHFALVIGINPDAILFADDIFIV